MNEKTYLSPEESRDLEIERNNLFRESIEKAYQSMLEQDNPMGSQTYEEENFSSHTFHTSIPREEFEAAVGEHARKSMEGFFNKLRREADHRDAEIHANFHKRKAWEAIGELIGVEDSVLVDPATPSYEIAFDSEGNKVMVFVKPPEDEDLSGLMNLLGIKE